jgi:hypothetical protein
MANLTLRRYIEILLVLELDLLNNPIHLDEIFRVQIIIDFEPSRIEDFFTLFHGSAVIDSNPLQGMIQICAITSEKEVPYDSFSTEDVKKMQDEEAFLRKEPVRMGVIQWIRDVDEFLDVTNSVVILTDECIELARQTTHLEIPTTFPQARGSGNSFVKKPASKMGYIECVLVIPFRLYTDILISSSHSRRAD